MPDLFSSLRRVNCPDGPRYFLKKPEQAFAIHFPQWEMRVDQLIQLYSKLDFKADALAKKKTLSIVKELTENYAALQAHYQAAYLGWCGNPCSHEAEKSYHEAKDIICSREFNLRQIETESGLASGKAMMRKDEKTNPLSQDIELTLGEKTTYTLDSVSFPTERLDKIQQLVSQLKV